MKTNLCLIILAASAFYAGAETEERLNQKFPVQPGGTLTVDVEFGSVEVTTNTDNAVIVEVLRTVSRSSKTEEEEYLAERPVVFSSEGGEVTITSQPKSKRKEASQGRQSTKGKYLISVPSQFTAHLKTGGGGITVQDLKGEVKASSGGGALAFTRIQGQLEGLTTGGTIKSLAVEGPQKLKTGGGNIEVNGGSGSCDGATSGGSVAVKEFRGAVQMKTAGGAIEMENVAGRIDGKTGGGGVAARFAKPPVDEVKLATAGGGVTLQVAENAGFDLDAATVGGSVSSELNVDHAGNKPPRGQLKGPVNGGGKTVVLRSAGGSIQVRKL